MLCFRKLKLAVFKTMQQQWYVFLYFMKEIITATSKEIPWSNNDTDSAELCDWADPGGATRGDLKGGLAGTLWAEGFHDTHSVGGELTLDDQDSLGVS